MIKQALTPRQTKVFTFIQGSIDKKGFPPTIREIARHLGLGGPKGIQKHLAALEAKGYIRRRSGLSRAIEVIEWATGMHRPSTAIPIAGRIQAGGPVLAVEEVEGYLRLDRSLAPQGAFLLRVRGDSMIQAGIYEGDWVVVRPQPQVNNGDIVVALIGEEATIKRFYKDRKTVRLEPAHPRMEPIVVQPGTEEMRIIGKVVAIVRKF
jgi:repressor LexA